jgi:hypothetical protein
MALTINAAQMFVPHMDGDEIICAVCGSFIEPETGIECLQAMVRLIVFGCKYCNGEDEPFPDDGESLDPHYELRVVMGREENSDAHWESADAEWHRQNDARWDNYVPEWVEQKTDMIPRSLLTDW